MTEFILVSMGMHSREGGDSARDLGKMNRNACYFAGN